MLPIPLTAHARKLALHVSAKARNLLGFEASSVKATRRSRVGIASSGLFFWLSGIWFFISSGRLPILVPYVLIGMGLVIVLISARKSLTLREANIFALGTHIAALLSFYFLASRFLIVTYSTDTIVGTYAGLVGVLNLQNPYLYSIRPFLDQFGLPPSSYTPRVDGSFEFRLNYPAFNFLSFLPLYLAGVRDLRDGVLFFHVMSVLLVFGLVPPRAKAIALAPFVFGLPLAIVYSWTDSVWAFLLLLGTAIWHKDRRLGLAMVGLAGATKQIALIVLPFLLIKLWCETTQSRRRQFLEGAGALVAGFMGPNLPFIISSPSSWWAGTVAAYFPGRAPQVAGGVGLSEILLALGIAPPPSFFVAMMGAVTTAMVVVYMKRFTKYNHLALAIPPVILFFYYRSFPNYIAYWLIPLLPELVRFRTVFFSPAHAATVRYAPWRVSVRLPLHRIRSRLASSALVVLVIVAVLAGVSGAYISRTESTLDIQVNRILDTDSIGAATALEVTLANMGTGPVSPRFFVRWSFLPFLWTTNSGENDHLRPGMSERYVLTATDARAAIPADVPFRLLVFNSVDGNLLSQSQTLRAALSPLTVTNPFFKWWTLDSETGRKVPFGWRLVLEATNPSSGIDELESDPSRGLQLRLNHTSEEGRPETLRVLQNVPFDTSSFRIMTLPSPNEEEIVFGARFSDGVHTLYYVFSGVTTSRVVRVHSENVTVTVPMDSGTWTWIRIDASSEWTIQGWSPPRTLEFSLFLQTVSKGVFYGYVQEIG